MAGIVARVVGAGSAQGGRVVNEHIVVSPWTSEQTARIAGTGIDVFEVILTYRELGCDWDALKRAFNWLSEDQLRAALAYYAEHTAALDERLAADDRVEERVEELWRKYTHTKPAWR